MFGSSIFDDFPDDCVIEELHSREEVPDDHPPPVFRPPTWCLAGGSPSSSTSSSSSASPLPTVPSTRTPIRKRRRRPAPVGDASIPCTICGDMANGYHYDIPSCNSCRVFFRRTILSKQGHQCQRGGKCYESLPRNQYLLCRSCRYNRCLEVGMKPEAVVIKSESRENPASEKQQQDGATTNMQVLPVVMRNRVDKANDLITYLIYVEDRHQSVRRSEYSPRMDSDIDLDYLLRTPSSLGMNYKEMQGWPVWNDPKLFDCQFPLEVHIEKREEVRMPLEYLSTRILKTWIYADSVYAIDYVKTFDFFQKLKYSDKVALLKHVTVLTSGLTSAFFSVQNNSILSYYPDGRTPYRNHEEYTTVIKFSAKRFIRDVKMDRPTYVLLKAIVACDPMAENLSSEGRAVLGKQRVVFAKALMAYLVTTYGHQKAPNMFAECMHLATMLALEVTKMQSLDALLISLKLKGKSKLGFEIGCIM